VPAQGVECGWKPAGWHVLTLLNSRPPSLPQPPEPTFAAPPKVLPEHHELVVGRGALLNSRIPSLPRPQEPISCSVNEHVFQASRAWYRASVGQARIHTCLGAEAGATMLTNTHTHNTHRLLPPSRLISKIHTREGCAHCRRPRKNKISDAPSKYIPRHSRDAFGSVSAFVFYFGRQLSSPQAPFGIHFSSSEGRWNSSGERQRTLWRPEEAPGTREATSAERGAVD